MKKQLKSKVFDIDFAKKEVVLHSEDAEDLGVRAGSRVRCFTNGKSTGAIVNTTEKFVKKGTVGIFDEVQMALSVKSGDNIFLEQMERPLSVKFIKKKLVGQKLKPDEIRRIIDDMVNGTMSDVEISAWVCALHAGGMDMDEIEVLTKAMTSSGDILDFGGRVFDKHSIGGVPGNKISPLIVPIVAAAGLKIPKTSSRAITSPAGAADVMEVFCPVSLSLEKIREVVSKTNGCLVWGGSVCLAPADDMMIHAEFPLDLDPRALLLASVMSKKSAVQPEFVAIDIPVGAGTKVANIQEGETLARDFIELGRRLGIRVECAITYGAQPVGHAAGPILEAREAYETLKNGEGPESLIAKSTEIAGIILEAGGVAPVGQGSHRALEILNSGAAYEKFLEIIKAQGGKKITKKTLTPGRHTYTLKAGKGGYISRVDNHNIKMIARLAGAPKDKGAGIILHKKIGTKASRGGKLLTIYAENKEKLDVAKKYAKANKPIIIESMVLERIHSSIRVQ